MSESPPFPSRASQSATGFLISTVLALICSACGGGSSGTPPTETSTEVATPAAAVSGVILPAQSGLIVVERDANGNEIQRSAASDASGAFVFPAPVTGVRLDVLTGDVALQAKKVLSARMVSDRATLQITPVTTLVDQFMLLGQSQADAASSVTAFIGGACGSAVTAELPQALFADTVDNAPTRDWLLLAAEGYATALRRIGVSSASSPALWSAKLSEHEPLMTQMCSLAQSIYGNDWLQATTLAINQQLNPATAVLADTVATGRSSVTQRILSLVGLSTLTLEYPDLADTIDIRESVWTGHETEFATSLAVADQAAQFAASNATASAVSAATATLATTRSNLYTRQGDLVASMTGVVSLVGAQVPQTVRISNGGAQDQAVDLYINGRRLKNIGDVIGEILAVPPLTPDEPVHQRAWRYVVAMSTHGYEVSDGLFVHQPDLFLRSLGIGLCDDQASALQWIWKALGYEARVDALNGHVVSEVLVNGHWEMYDPDYAVYYFMANGTVAGVTDLQADPTLVNVPINPILPLTAPAYWPAIAAIYADVAGTSVPFEWYSTPTANPIPGDLWVPGGGHVDVVPAVQTTMVSPEAGGSAVFSSLQIWIPPGYQGTLPLPGVLADITGDGQVTLNGTAATVTASGIAGTVAAYYATAPDNAIPSIGVSSVGSAGLTAVVLLNPKLFSVDTKHLTVQLRAPTLDSISMSSSTATAAQ